MSLTRKIIVFAIVLSALSTIGVEARNDKKFKETIHEHDKRVISYWLSGLRGLWEGYQKTLFHNKRQFDQRCLSSAIQDDISSIMYFLMYWEFSELLTTADSVYSLLNESLWHCGMDDTIKLIT